VNGHVVALDRYVKLHKKKKENRNHAVSVDLPYATCGVSTHEPNLTKRRTMMPREEGHRQEKKGEGNTGHRALNSEVNKQSTLRGLGKSTIS